MKPLRPLFPPARVLRCGLSIWLTAFCGACPNVVLVAPMASTQDGGAPGLSDGSMTTVADGSVTVLDDAGTPTPDGGTMPESWIGPRCFPEVWHPELDNPHYEQFVPVVADHCQGTHHQDIRGVERVVFLGDSITAGTPPTLPNQLYRMRLEQRLREAFGQDITVDNCSRIGARSSDFFDGNTPQLAPCFPYPEDARVTLTIMTMGGNNMADLQRVGQDGAPLEETMGRANLYLDEMDRALGFLKDPQRFPNGSFVVFSNLYEFTDGTGDVASCASARLAGLTGVWNDGPQVLIHVNEQLMRLAVQHRADMLFTLEHFCGHGFHNNDPGARCYRGPDTPRWFDLTCIHPTPTGHGVLADMFAQTILAAP